MSLYGITYISLNGTIYNSLNTIQESEWDILQDSTSYTKILLVYKNLNGIIYNNLNDIQETKETKTKP